MERKQSKLRLNNFLDISIRNNLPHDVFQNKKVPFGVQGLTPKGIFFCLKLLFNRIRFLLNF